MREMGPASVASGCSAFPRNLAGIVANSPQLGPGCNRASSLLDRIAFDHRRGLRSGLGSSKGPGKASFPGIQFALDRLAGHRKRSFLSGDALFDARAGELTNRLQRGFGLQIPPSRIFLVANRLRA